MDKINRYSVEEGSFNEKVERTSDTVRDSFSQGDLNKILSDADKQFGNINDKAKFLVEQLQRIKELRSQQYNDERKDIEGENDPLRRASRMQGLSERFRYNNADSPMGKAYYEFVEQVKRIADSLDKKNVDEKREPKQEPEEPPVPPPTPPEDKRYGFGEFDDHIRSLLNKGILGLLGSYSAIVASLINMTKKGYDDIRSENNVKRRFDITDDFAKSFQLNNLELGTGEFRDLAIRTATSRRSGYDAQRIALSRALFGRGYGLEENEIAGFDQFYSAGRGGVNLNDINQGSDATHIIAEILARSERYGILGVSGSDFTRLPEKIAQVQSIMGMQYQAGEKTDATAAVNMMIAGQQIGGRFADGRLSEVMGRMNSSIQNPGGPGMRAFVFEALRRSNPNANYTDILAQMENGASAENLSTILPTIANLPQGEMRRMVLFQFTKNMQDAIRLDASGNIRGMLSQLQQKPLTDREYEAQVGKAEQRNNRTTTDMDRTWQAIKNATTETAHGISQIVEKMLKTPNMYNPTYYIPGVGIQNYGSNLVNKNILQSGSPSGEQIKQ